MTSLPSASSPSATPPASSSPADRLAAATALVRPAVPPTPQIAWPLLRQAFGTPVWIKHENHAPTGAFKVRGALVHLHRLRAAHPGPHPGVIAATRGNFGQAVGFAALRADFAATIVVPHGNSRDKNDAMRVLGVDLVEHGDDFQAAREHAGEIAAQRGLHFIDSFHPDLVEGVATYWAEFLQAVPDLDVAYVPLGQGSGLCAAALARRALGHRVRLVGVVSAHAPTYALSFRAREVVAAPVTTRLADGLACRIAHPVALETILAEADDVVTVDDAQVAEAMCLSFRTTHNTTEGAAAAALAAAWRDRDRLKGRVVGIPLTGGNVDGSVFGRVLTGSA
jgi:threonine dehydratase